MLCIALIDLTMNANFRLQHLKEQAVLDLSLLIYFYAKKEATKCFIPQAILNMESIHHYRIQHE